MRNNHELDCGICAERCPYGTISIITLSEERSLFAGKPEPFKQYCRQSLSQDIYMQLPYLQLPPQEMEYFQCVLVLHGRYLRVA